MPFSLFDQTEWTSQCLLSRNIKAAMALPLTLKKIIEYIEMPHIQLDLDKHYKIN